MWMSDISKDICKYFIQCISCSIKEYHSQYLSCHTTESRSPGFVKSRSNSPTSLGFKMSEVKNPRKKREKNKERSQCI